MVVEVHGVIATHAQETAALGLSRFGTPEGCGTREGQDGHREAGRKAHVQQLTTAETFSKVGIGTLCVHRDPSLWYSCMRSATVGLGMNRCVWPRIPRPHP
jgi:hypothetical protein